MGNLDSLAKRIIEKKELSGISLPVIEEHIDKYLKKNKLLLEKVSPAELKVIIKDIRAGLRENVGRFQTSSKNRYKMLENGDIDLLLNTHSSTKERIKFYPALKNIIKRLNPSSILDLGSGINPIAISSPSVKYYASDINQEDLRLVQLYFHKNKIDGKIFTCDLTKIEKCPIPEVDLCLIMKVFDILGKKNYQIAKSVLERVRAKNIIVSFSIKTLSGKQMNYPRRIWFEKLLGSLLYKFEIINSDNEIFYLI